MHYHTRQVEIPFKWWFRQDMLYGNKTCTSRTSKMADEGDIFVAFGERFTISKVWRTSLGIVMNGLWKEEGTQSPAGFKEVWMKIHPKKRFDEATLVWVHSFYLTKKGPPPEPPAPHDEGDEAP
jgi:hypothetical protein